MENIDKAIGIRNQIIKEVGFNEKGMIYWGNNDFDIGAFPNSIFALLQATLGEEKKARNIRDAIKREIGFNHGGLVNIMVNHPEIDEDEMPRRGVYPTGPTPSANAAFGLLELGLGERDKATIIRDTMKKEFPFNSHGEIGGHVSEYDDMNYCRIPSINYSTSSTNLFRLLDCALEGDSNEKNKPIQELPDREDCCQYLLPKLFDRFLGNEVTEEEILRTIKEGKVKIRDGLIFEYCYDSYYNCSRHIASTITNSVFALLYVTDKFKERLNG